MKEEPTQDIPINKRVCPTCNGKGHLMTQGPTGRPYLTKCNTCLGWGVQNLEKAPEIVQVAK